MPKTFAYAGGGFLAIGLFILWYSIAANYDYDALAGIYTFHRDGEKCTLELRPNQTFVQELSRGGVVQDVQGRWHRYGQARVSFSSEFLRLAGQELDAAGEADGQFDKTLGLLPRLTLSGGPTFRKKWFH